MEKTSRIFFKSVYSGVIISIASIVNMSVDNRVVGAFLFSIGLTAVFTLGSYLFTGAVGNTAARHEKGWLRFLLIVLAGNLAGTLLAGLILSGISYAGPVVEAASASWETKMLQNAWSAFLSSCLCGFLMYTAWGANTKMQDRPVIATLVVVLCVMTFVLARFDHSIANAFLIFASGAWDGASFLWLLIMIAGNSVGAVLPAYIFLPDRRTS